VVRHVRGDAAGGADPALPTHRTSTGYVVRLIAEKLSLPADEGVIAMLADKYSKANIHKFANAISEGDSETR
jgi:hypothetical protein